MVNTVEYKHKTVLLNETVENVLVQDGKKYVDATFGGGGHSSLILNSAKNIELFVFDKDLVAIENGKEKFKDYDNIIFINDDFSNIKKDILNQNVDKVDGIIADFGVSSYQLDTAYRGFSYMQDAPLDMRMDRKNTLSAYEVINNYSEDELHKIIKDYGEEKRAKYIARTIIERRSISPIKTTFELVDIIMAAVPARYREQGKHPARKTFQAIRIEVNQELKSIKTFINDAFELLSTGGRLSVITFHSLEDRIVKNAFKDFSTGCTCPPDFPVCVCGKKERGKLITKKPILPSAEEIEENSRAKSAKLRVIEKL